MPIELFIFEVTFTFADGTSKHVQAKRVRNSWSAVDVAMAELWGKESPDKLGEILAVHLSKSGPAPLPNVA